MAMGLIIDIFNSEVDLKNLESTLFIVPNTSVKLNTERLTVEERSFFYFVGFNQIKNKGQLTLQSLLNLKHSLNRNMGLCIIYKLIEEMKNYQYFLISPIGVDVEGVN